MTSSMPEGENDHKDTEGTERKRLSFLCDISVSVVNVSYGAVTVTVGDVPVIAAESKAMAERL